MTNEELLTELVRLQFRIEALDATLSAYTDDERLAPGLRRIERMRSNFRKISTKLITTSNIAQQWIYYTGGLTATPATVGATDQERKS